MIEIKKPQMLFVRDRDKDPKTYGKFVIEPLERGFGVTLGNSLRRVLLASLPGAAVTAIRIDGVLHEFSTIDGIIEDVTDIILNVKQLIVRYEGHETVTARIEKKGPGVVTAADITCPGGVTIVNKDQHIATLNEQGKLIMEMEIRRGRGYVTAEHNTSVESDINTLLVDSSFSPIQKVHYTVEDTRVGQDINYDRLVLELWTNGAILPDEATSIASQFLIQHLGLFVDCATDVKDRLVMVSEEKEAVNKNLDIPIKDIEFSVRSRNCLKRTEIKTLGDLARMSAAELLEIKNFGMKSLNEVKEKLDQYGLGLRDETLPTEEN